MKCNRLLQRLACVASVPVVVGTLATTTYQKPAIALSTSTPINETTHNLSTTEPTFPEIPTAIISQYQSYRFRLENARSIPITYFYASSSDSGYWGRDLLGNDIVSPYSGGTVTIDDGYASCLYDLKAVFSDGSETTRYNVDICETSQLSFN